MAVEDTFRSIAKWSGFVGSLLTFILGLVHICYIKASIHFPGGSMFAEDVNQANWRLALFTLNPMLALDIWTPFVFGIVGMMAHWPKFKHTTVVTDNYVNFFVFQMVSGLFATIGYNGGLGVIFSIPVFVSALFSFIVLLMKKDTNASLAFNDKMKPEQP